MMMTMMAILVVCDYDMVVTMMIFFLIVDPLKVYVDTKKNFD